jgi:thymidylate kinase
MKQRRSPWLCVLGPDGSGKSTLLDHLETRLKMEGQWRGVARFHWRPGVLRGRSHRGAPITLPHGSPAYGTAISVSKLAFLYIDWLLGFWFRLYPLLSRGYVVLFDRHLLDMHVDPQRYRYGGPQGLVQLAVRFLPFPDLVVILDAPVEVIQGRKQEVPPEETVRQLTAYRLLASTMTCAHVFDATRDAEELAAEITDLLGRVI